MLEQTLSQTAAAVMVALAGYFVLRHRHGAALPMAVLFLLLAALEIVGDSATWLHPGGLPALQVRLYLESVLPAALLAFGFTYQKEVRSPRFIFAWYILFAASALLPLLHVRHPLDSFFSSPFPGSERTLFLNGVGYWFFLAITIACVITLVNIEAVFVLRRGMERWKVKFEIIGLSAMMAVLTIFYSQGLLYRTISMGLRPVRSVVLIMGALLILYSRVFRGSGSRVAVSRHFIYRSLSLFAVALYLLAVGVLGEGLKYLRGSLKGNLLVLLSITGGILLVSVLLSEKLRRLVKVFVVKNFFQGKHDYRIAWVHLTDQLASCRSLDELQETILAAYRSSFGLMGAALYLADRTRNVYRLAAASSMHQCDQELIFSPELLAYYKERDRVINLADPENPLSGAEADQLRRMGAILMVPLICGQAVEGVVVLGHQLVTEELIYDDYDLMKTIARQAAAAIVNYRLLEELAEAREIAAVARISSFVIHDLKNMTSAMSLLATNAEEHIGDPQFQRDVVQTIKSSLEKMRLLSRRLRSVPERSVLRARPTDLFHTCAATVNELAKHNGDIALTCTGNPVTVYADEEELRKVVTNIVQNALDACGKAGTVTAEVLKDGRFAVLRVTDTGCGMDPEFLRTRLFRPFRTTKDTGLGIGLYQARQIIDAHRGRIEVESALREGSMVKIYLPLYEADGGHLAHPGTVQRQ